MCGLYVDRTVHMQTIQIVLDTKLLKASDGAAKRQKVNRSALIRRALQEYLKRLRVVDLEERDRLGMKTSRNEVTNLPEAFDRPSARVELQRTPADSCPSYDRVKRVFASANHDPSPKDVIRRWLPVSTAACHRSFLAFEGSEFGSGSIRRKQGFRRLNVHPRRCADL